MRTPPPGARGFTLLELLVAVTILAVVAILSWRGLSTLSATRERLEPLAAEVQSLLAGLGQLQIDLSQAPLNAQLYALPVQPVRVLTLEGHPALQLVRLAPSPDGSRASALQAVSYVIVDGALVRRSTAAQRSTALAGGPVESVVLLRGVDDLQVRIWRDHIGWISPASDADTANAAAIEVTLMRHDGTAVRRVYLVG